MKAQKFSVYLHSDVLKWISVGLFLPEGTLSHVTALWWFHVMFYSPVLPKKIATLGPEQAEIKLSY
jgi:hypothetical protein